MLSQTWTVTYLFHHWTLYQQDLELSTEPCVGGEGKGMFGFLARPPSQNGSKTNRSKTKEKTWKHSLGGVYWFFFFFKGGVNSLYKWQCVLSHSRFFNFIKCVCILTDVLKRMLSEMLKLTYLVEEVQILFVDLKWKYVQMLLVSMLCYCSVYDEEHMNWKKKKNQSVS